MDENPESSGLIDALTVFFSARLLRVLARKLLSRLYLLLLRFAFVDRGSLARTLTMPKFSVTFQSR